MPLFDPNSTDSILTKIFDRFDAMETRFDTFDSRIAALTSQVAKMNGRVGRLELWRSGVVGGLAVLVLIIGWYLTYHEKAPRGIRFEDSSYQSAFSPNFIDAKVSARTEPLERLRAQ